MLQASVEKITLEFKRPAGTSRGVLKTKNSWILSIWDDSNPDCVGKGEASIIDTLSPEWSDEYEAKMQEVVANIHHFQPKDLVNYPSIRFAYESALLDLKMGGNQVYFQSNFTNGLEGIKINGLIWMGEKGFMKQQIVAKLEAGFSCLKLKIGAIDFEAELELLKYIRSQFSAETLELRVDANGAFSAENALSKLEVLNQFELHSIEQPIKQGQWDEMRKLCLSTPLPIALDEELIGIHDFSMKLQMLKQILPQYIILKPSLVGGFQASDDWIHGAESLGIDWWITSALEANVGLNAIAQYTATKKNPMPQGLGTGSLFTNNTDSTLEVRGEQLFHH